MYKEEFNFTDVPTQNFILPYILLMLHELGGTAKKKEVVEKMAKLFDLSDEILEKKHRGGEPVFGNNAAFGRLRLKEAGYLDAPKFGVWGLTEKGREKVKELYEGDKNKFDNFREEVSKLVSIKSGERKKDLSKLDAEKEVEEIEADENLEENWILKDLEKIKNMDPFAFERLCSKLFKAVGYEDVEVTKKSRDEGIDGIGYLAFGLVRFKVVFQAKRFTDTKVSSKDIDALGGTMRKTGSEKAIFITTSAFTRGARKAALEYGIELVNGEKLMELLFKYEIGYSKNLDEEFLKNI